MRGKYCAVKVSKMSRVRALVWVYMCSRSIQVMAKTSPEKKQGQEQGRGQGEMSTPSTEASSPRPPSRPSPPEEAEADVSDDADFTDAATEPSAWEQTSSSASVLNADKMETSPSTTSTSASTTSVGVSRVTVGPAETLDVRIFCGTWNVAGLSVCVFFAVLGIACGFLGCNTQQYSRAGSVCLVGFGLPTFYFRVVCCRRACAKEGAGPAGKQQPCIYVNGFRTEHNTIHLFKEPDVRTSIFHTQYLGHQCGYQNEHCTFSERAVCLGHILRWRNTEKSPPQEDGKRKARNNSSEETARNITSRHATSHNVTVTRNGKTVVRHNSRQKYRLVSVYDTAGLYS